MDDKSTASGIDKEKFMSVWQRVRGESGGAPDVQRPEADVQRLCTFIKDEAEDMKTYMALAKRFSGRAAAVLLEIAADEKQHMHRLQTAYFMRTGDTCGYKPAVDLNVSALECLRRRYYKELEGAESYRRAAGETGDRALRDTFNSIAADEERHAERILTLIGQLMS